MKAIVTWVLVADGARAEIFVNDGPGKGLHPADLQFEQEPLQAHEIMSDRPGRSISSMGGGGRSAIEYSSDPVAVRERRFVEMLAAELDKHHTAGAFDRLIIAAAPTALGDIRPALSKGVRDAITAELPKDLTKTPKADLAKHFESLLAV